MDDSLLSAYWYRVAGLRPRLRAHVKVRRCDVRAEPWYLLMDTAEGRQHRLNAGAYAIIGRCDGERTLAEIWDTVLEEAAEHAPTQPEVVQLVAQLNAAELLQCELPPDLVAMFEQRREHAAERRRSRLNPLAFRVELGNPRRLLAAIEPWLGWWIAPWVGVLWAIVVGSALILTFEHWQEIVTVVSSSMLTPRYLIVSLCCYPLLKLLHELGHALAIRRFGGEVTNVGFTLFVLVPAPFVDASAAAAFPRRQRMLVSAVGIMIELFLAALALFVWINASDGLLRDIAAVVMVLGGASTVLFNGNPLQRFDAYYLLSDIIDVPNLATRSVSYWRTLIFRHVLRLSVRQPPLAPGERGWLAAYAPLSWLFRCYLLFLIVLWAGAKAAVLGIALAVLACVLLVWRPLQQFGTQAMALAGSGGARTRLLLTALALTLACIGIAVPMPFATVAPAVVWLPDQAQARAQSAGLITQVVARDGAWVAAGQPLARLQDPELDARRAIAAARLAALEVEHFEAMTREAWRLPQIAARLKEARAARAEIDQRIAGLTIRSTLAGRLVLDREDDLEGAWLAQGDIFGYVLPRGPVTVRAVVAQEDAALVRQNTLESVVLIAGSAGSRGIPAAAPREVRAGERRLPSRALADRYGGGIVSDAGDPESLRTRDSLFLFDVMIPAGSVAPVGGRARVRFDHAWTPLAAQVLRHARQVFLAHFDPTG